ncbi:MAG: hypothetical protein WA060_02155 [Minisyncoccia bacterium]
MKKSGINNGGFLQIIIFIIVALLIMKYFNVTISEVINWFKTFFAGVLR